LPRLSDLAIPQFGREPARGRLRGLARKPRAVSARPPAAHSPRAARSSGNRPSQRQRFLPRRPRAGGGGQGGALGCRGGRPRRAPLGGVLSLAAFGRADDPADGVSRGRERKKGGYSFINCCLACSAKCSSSKRTCAGVMVTPLAVRSPATLSMTCLSPPASNSAATISLA
jgi:hypothetical protein